ncbi:RNA polymerase sigma factor RpoE [Granulicella sibirica]|uniref:RNA polymerase sigma factor RpoE n=2 Tax=Granulicella sibirica TaxID=2479048 RepID=A0A4V1L5U9_9BACT|nr:RNA polymerase sigma factor RpoE [Granulicella sibirica]
MSTVAIGLELASTGTNFSTRPDHQLTQVEGLPMTLVPPVDAPPATPEPAKPNSGLFKRNPPIAGEAEAIEAAKNGDAEAFSKLYALHKRRVYTLCLRMLGNVSEAEDMTQEAFLHLFRKLGSFRGESAFSTWLHRLTVNLVLMHLRKKGLNLVSLEETINPSEDDAPKRDFGSRDPMLSGSVDRVALERAVASLPPGYRMVFVLHDVEGFEHNEIATMLACSTGNSKSQLHKARLKLRELLRQNGQSTQLPSPTQGTKEIAL